MRFKIKHIIKSLFCEHDYIWQDHWVDEHNNKLIIDEFYCEKCQRSKKEYTWSDKQLTNDDL